MENPLIALTNFWTNVRHCESIDKELRRSLADHDIHELIQKVCKPYEYTDIYEYVKNSYPYHQVNGCPFTIEDEHQKWINIDNWYSKEGIERFQGVIVNKQDNNSTFAYYPSMEGVTTLGDCIIIGTKAYPIYTIHFKRPVKSIEDVKQQ